MAWTSWRKVLVATIAVTVGLATFVACASIAWAGGDYPPGTPEIGTPVSGSGPPNTAFTGADFDGVRIAIVAMILLVSTAITALWVGRLRTR